MGKSARKITNWSHYNKALINLGSLMIWIVSKPSNLGVVLNVKVAVVVGLSFLMS
tara:strand:+ start:11024 stop:11188 length:165 start_codon:yes stop_codon:yes gene_type:complete